MPAQSPPEHRRRVRSFVRRAGRLTPAQERALAELLPRYRIDPELTDLREAFASRAPLVVEIGFGNGEALAAMAEREPDKNFVGIEVHEPGVGRLLRAVDAAGLTNVRVAMRDAVEVLREQARPASIDELRIYFPDPWPKKRHYKRRLIQPAFVELAVDRLADGGLLHLATDWQPYAERILETLGNAQELENLGQPWIERPEWRPQTHFEKRGEKRGHQIRDVLCKRRAR
ncbi:MAG: tRNA (guanosine(46)-N7)-methyltransferase TrmB [Wenzhouxiangellaceae bacterium]|nr:tRNA (guanosine(46)-N7)-methyltransferase TrmB [Wenzhouxiangellaceae bacterium]